MRDWHFKVYTITLKNSFTSHQIYENARKQTAEWVLRAQNYPLPNYKIGCLIVHEGREGVFTLINWWIDENMMQHYVFFTPYNEPAKFEAYSERGIQFCVWELGVIWHERNQWIEHVLKKPDAPDFEGYLQAAYDKDRV